MGNLDEHLRLPHGMFDRDAKWIKRARVILNQHERIGRSIGCEVKKYTPLGYSETYQRGTNAATDKVYQFNSKTGKSLMLSSDSTPSIFREYLSNGDNKSKRISFVAPLFRYRNSHSRHFSQIGYAIINEPKDQEEIDVHIVELAKTMISLCQSVGIKTKIYINNYEALRNMLSGEISEDNMPDVLHKLQFLTTEERIDFFRENIKDPKKCNQLIKLFQIEPTVIKPEDEKDNKLELPDEFLGIYRMVRGLKEATDIEIIFDPTNLHSVETLDNYAIRFVTLDGSHLGDGGEYTNYAKRFDERISSFWSVASGVEALERNSPMVLEPDKLRKLALYNTDANALFVLQAIKALEQNGYAVVYQGSNIKIGKAIKKLDEDFTHISILGKNEELGEDISIRDLKTREVSTVISPNNIEVKTLDKSSEEYSVKNGETSDSIKSIIKLIKTYLDTGTFKREDLIEMIASHADKNETMLLSSSDIETLIVEVGKAYNERGLFNKKEDKISIEK